MKRRHDNLIYGFGCLDSSRPLDFFDPINSPRVYGRPTNIRQIVSFWGRLKAAWEVLTLNAVAVRWYDEKNAHRHGRVWYEAIEEESRRHQRSVIARPVLAPRQANNHGTGMSA